MSYYKLVFSSMTLWLIGLVNLALVCFMWVDNLFSFYWIILVMFTYIGASLTNTILNIFYKRKRLARSKEISEKLISVDINEIIEQINLLDISGVDEQIFKTINLSFTKVKNKFSNDLINASSRENAIYKFAHRISIINNLIKRYSLNNSVKIKIQNDFLKLLVFKLAQLD